MAHQAPFYGVPHASYNIGLPPPALHAQHSFEKPMYTAQQPMVIDVRNGKGLAADRDGERAWSNGLCSCCGHVRSSS